MRIGVLAPVTGGFYIGEVLEGIAAAAADVGAHVVVIQTLDAGSTADGMRPPVPTPLPGADCVDGFVVLPWAGDASTVHRLRERGQPVVLVSSVLPVDAPCVAPDNWSAVQDAVHHLRGHGHRRFVFVGDLSNSDVRERLAACSDALEGVGLAAPRVLETSGNLESAGRSAAHPFAHLEPRPTAVIAATDRVALGLMDALVTEGLSVPGDVALVGFDDLDAGRHHKPTLATVHQDFATLGRTAASLLISTLRGQPASSARTSGLSTFVPRQSCGCTREGLPRLEELGASLGRRLADGALVRLRSDGGAPTGAAERLEWALLQVAEELVAERLPPEAVAHAVRALIARLASRHAGVCGEPGTEAIVHMSGLVAAALLRAESAHGHGRLSRLSTTLGEQYEVGVGLLGHLDEDPTALTWLHGSGVDLGVLALWRRGPTGAVLRVAGTHDPHGALSPHLADEYAGAAFPPPALVDAADPAAGHVAYVVPVRGASGDFGLLCLVAPIEGENSTIRGTFNNWAALLGAALRQRRLTEELRTSEERRALAAQATRDGLWDWDLEADVAFYSERSRVLLGRGGARLGSRPSGAAWLEAVVGEDRQRVEEALGRTVEHLEPLEVEFRVAVGGGDHAWVQCRAFPVGSAGSHATRLVGAFSDVQERKDLEQRLRYGALHDSVTGLPNRRYFLDRLDEMLRAAKDLPVHGDRRCGAVAFIDLDDFKSVNDSLGHAAGDELLRVVAGRLRMDLRDADVPARLGGDEFAVLIGSAEESAVLQIVERVLARIACPVALADRRVMITASAGVAFVDGAWESTESIMVAADTAMYEAKGDGKAVARVWRERVQ